MRPLLLQAGGIPIWIAGGGEKVTLKITAPCAQYTNFCGTSDEFDAKSAILRHHCAEVGTDFDAITRSANYNVVIVDTEEEEVAEHLAAISDRVLPYIGAERAAYDRSGIELCEREVLAVLGHP